MNEKILTCFLRSYTEFKQCKERGSAFHGLRATAWKDRSPPESRNGWKRTLSCRYWCYLIQNSQYKQKSVTVYCNKTIQTTLFCFTCGRKLGRQTALNSYISRWDAPAALIAPVRPPTHVQGWVGGGLQHSCLPPGRISWQPVMLSHTRLQPSRRVHPPSVISSQKASTCISCWNIFSCSATRVAACVHVTAGRMPALCTNTRVQVHLSDGSEDFEWFSRCMTGSLERRSELPDDSTWALISNLSAKFWCKPRVFKLTSSGWTRTMQSVSRPSRSDPSNPVCLASVSAP